MFSQNIFLNTGVNLTTYDYKNSDENWRWQQYTTASMTGTDEQIDEKIARASRSKIMKKIHPDINPELNRLAAIVNESKDKILKEII